MDIALVVVTAVLAVVLFAAGIALSRRAEAQRRRSPQVRTVRPASGADPERGRTGRGSAGAAGAVERLAVGALVAFDHQSFPVVGVVRRTTVEGDPAAGAQWCLDAGPGVGTTWVEVDGASPASVTLWRPSAEGVEALAGRAPGEDQVRWRDAMWPRVAAGVLDAEVEGDATAPGPASPAATGRVRWSEHRYPGAGNRRLLLEEDAAGTASARVGEVMGVRTIDVHPPLELGPRAGSGPADAPPPG